MSSSSIQREIRNAQMLYDEALCLCPVDGTPSFWFNGSEHGVHENATITLKSCHQIEGSTDMILVAAGKISQRASAAVIIQYRHRCNIAQQASSVRKAELKIQCWQCQTTRQFTLPNVTQSTCGGNKELNNRHHLSPIGNEGSIYHHYRNVIRRTTFNNQLILRAR